MSLVYRCPTAQALSICVLFIVNSVLVNANATSPQANQSSLVSATAEFTDPLVTNPPAITSKISAAEKKWLQRFMDGNFLVTGWQAITEQVVKKTPRQDQKYRRQVLMNLGVKIGREWAKDNDIRKINNNMLRNWGDRFKICSKRHPERLPALIQAITHEVNQLIAPLPPVPIPTQVVNLTGDSPLQLVQPPSPYSTISPDVKQPSPSYPP